VGRRHRHARGASDAGVAGPRRAAASCSSIPSGVTGDWLPGAARPGPGAPGPSAATRPARAALLALSPDALADPDPARHAAYARAFFPAWFADPALAGLFTPPADASVTGATIAARLRREGYDWRDELRGLRAPSLVVHGEDDPLDPAVARATVATSAR
jgi:proline iminopeptidase